METKFVPTFASPRAVYKHCACHFIGVFEGARKFDNGKFALLKDGEVTLYRNIAYAPEKVVFSGLEDVFVAPNGYILLKRKGEGEWQLLDNNQKVLALGEKVGVFQKESLCLVFLKQQGKAEWVFYDVNKNNFMPSERTIVADEIDVRYDCFSSTSSRLLFIIKLGGKTKLLRVTTLFFELAEELEVPNYYLLPNGDVVVSQNPFQIYEGYNSVKILPAEGEVLTVYSEKLAFDYCTDGIAFVGKVAVFRRLASKWNLFVGKKLVKDGIADLYPYVGVMAYPIGLEGQTSDGTSLTALVHGTDKVVVECGKERFFIFSDEVMPVVISANDVDDVFLV